MKFFKLFWSWLKWVTEEDSDEVLAELLVGSVVTGLFLGMMISFFVIIF